MKHLRKDVFIALLLWIAVILSLSWVFSTSNSITSSQTIQKGSSQTEEWWIPKAKKMVNQQIISRGVKDKRVINVMRNTPRHLFVLKSSRAYAYEDHPLKIEGGQTISQPYIVAFMTELLELEGDEKILEIGTGSGYQAAILSKLVKSVYTIEIVKELADTSTARLKRLGYDNVYVKWGDGYKGWPEQAPFDGIIVTAAPEQVPEALAKQLKEVGRMVIPVGTYYQELMVITKEKGEIKKKNVLPVRFVPMVHPEDKK